MQNTIVFVSKDVFFWPVVKSAAQQVNGQLVIGTRLDDSKIEAVDGNSVGIFLIDLAAIEVAGLTALIAEARAKFPAARILAFGSHVHESRLNCAKEAGCDLVITRGQFSAKPDEYLKLTSEG